MSPLACPFCRIALAAPETVCPRDGHAGEAAVWDVVPSALGKRFSVLEPFARGATGSLYLADESESGRRGLLKILGGVPKHREPERARLRRELAKQATLAQSRLVVPWASGETEAVTWVFRPWLDGVSLRVRLRQAERLPTDDALAIGAQLTIALDELHRGGLLHRDIKPGHVFLPTGAQAGSRALLIEAGVCASLVRPGNSTIFGSPGYVAPEQLSGKLVSFRSDLYSLGCVMYEMLAGHPPFLGESDSEVLARQLSGELPELPGALPDGIGALLRSLLAREPQERPFSAQKVRRILDPYAPDGSSMNRQPTSTFATLPETDKPAVKPAGGAVSVPPPPPPAALKSSKPSAPPRPTTRGMAPPPPPRGSHARGEISSLEIDMIEEVDEPRAAEHTQELGTEHLFDVRRAGQTAARATSSRPASEPPKDLTVPIRLDQVLAIAPARMRSAAPPLPEPERTPEPEAPPAPEPEIQAPEHARKGTQLGFPQPAPQLEGLTARAEQQTREPAATAAVESSLFGRLPATDSADAPADAAAGEDAADKTTVTSHSDAPPALAPHDEAATIAMSASFERQLASENEERQADNSEPQALRDTLPPWLMGPLGDYRKFAYAGAAVAALALGVFGVRAIFGDNDDELAAAQAAPPALPGSGPTVEPVPAVEPAPSVTALAKPPRAAPHAQPSAERAPPPAAPAPAPAAPEPAAPASPAVQAAPQQTAEPVAVAPEPVPADEAPLAEPAPSDAPSSAPVAMKTAEQEKPAALSARVTREDRRRERRERREREIAEKKAAKAELKAAKAVDASAERESKWAEARDLARSHYAAKRYKQAAQAYERAGQYDPTNAGTFAGLGAARLQAGDPKGAIAAYQRAIQLAPSTAGFHAALGRAYAAVGDKSKARSAYQRALSLDPNNASAKSSLKELGG